MKKKVFAFTVVFMLLTFCTVANANTNTSSFNCPNTFKTIQVGDSMEAVQAACGPASSTATKQVQETTPTTTVQWTYSLGWMNGAQTSLLPSLVLTFKNNKVTQITRSGAPVALGAYCVLNGVINIGDSSDKVLQVCGEPNVISQSQQANTTTKTLIVWTYNYGPYRPQMILQFENGALSQITAGQLGS